MASNRKTKTFKYVETYDNIINLINELGLKPGDLIPSEHSLSQKFNVSRGTIRAAIALLREDGMIYNHQGKGNVLIDRNKSNLEGLENVTIPIYTFNNVEYTRVEVATFFQPASNKMKEFLENEENFIVMIANVKYYIDNEVVGLLMYFLNYEDIKNYDLEIKTELELKRLLDDYIKNVVNSELVFESFDARPAVAQKMNIEIGDTIIYFSEQMKRDNNTIALYRRSYFNPNYYSFKINRAMK